MGGFYSNYRAAPLYFSELRSAGKLMKTMTIIKIDYPRNALGGVQGREITHPQV